MVSKGLFITGTDTNVGKTVVSAAIMQRYRSINTSINKNISFSNSIDNEIDYSVSKDDCLVKTGTLSDVRFQDYIKLRYWKPIQTGIEADDDSQTVKEMAQCLDKEIFSYGIRLPKPLSPHLSARLAHTTIEIAPLITIWRAEEAATWIVEGAGGIYVPLNEKDLMIDLMVQLDLAVLVVARASLGTINHTLLTLAALRASKLSIAGVIMVGEKNEENRAAIEQYGEVKVIAQMPKFAPLSYANLAHWVDNEFDLDNRLEPFLL